MDFYWSWRFWFFTDGILNYFFLRLKRVSRRRCILKILFWSFKPSSSNLWLFFHESLVFTFQWLNFLSNLNTGKKYLFIYILLCKYHVSFYILYLTSFRKMKRKQKMEKKKKENIKPKRVKCVLFAYGTALGALTLTLWPSCLIIKQITVVGVLWVDRLPFVFKCQLSAELWLQINWNCRSTFQEKRRKYTYFAHQKMI